MKRKRKEVLFEKEVYDAPSIIGYIEKEVFPYVPYWHMSDMKAECDLVLERYGVIHDCGFVVRIERHGENRNGRGWANAEEEYSALVGWAKECWEIAIDYSYH